MSRLDPDRQAGPSEAKDDDPGIDGDEAARADGQVDPDAWASALAQDLRLQPAFER
jgi:hypothetical protein